MNKRIVITGLGIIAPIGIGKNDYFNGLIKGKTGFKPIALFNTSNFNVHIAGEIGNFDPVIYLGKKDLRILDRSTKLLNSAAKLAIEDSNIHISDNNTHSIGVSIGTTFGSLHSISQFDSVSLTEGPKYVNPSHFPNTVINSPASQVSIRFNIKGFNTTISTGFCASLDAVAYASNFINLNRANVVLAGGVEELCEETFLTFYNLGYLSGTDGSEPLCCPFDARRNGFILSEGAAVIILEDEEHALKRKVEILAYVLGYGNFFNPEADIYFNHSGNGLLNAITSALNDASISPEKIDYISASANSTQGLDSMETRVFKKVFGKHIYKIPVSSIKSMIGESYSASGALSLAAAVCSLQKGIIPPTVNYSVKDSECDLDYVPNIARIKNINNILLTASDPYGHNAALIIGKFGG